MITVVVTMQAKDTGKQAEIYKQCFDEDKFDLSDLVLSVNKKSFSAQASKGLMSEESAKTKEKK